MFRTCFRFLATVAGPLLALAACAKSEPLPAAQAAVPAVATAAAGMSGSFRDTASNSADRGRIRGAEGAQVWLVEISDFQCPYCKRWHDDVYRTLDKEYVQTGKVRVAYLNFPLTSIHPNARAASEAAMCGSVQGKFWELHDALFDAQEKWAPLKDPMPLFDSLAVAAGANGAAWRGCMASHATVPLIEADQGRASRAGVRSTPSFFIGNRGLVGSYPVDSFRVVLDSALAHAPPR